MSSTKIPGIKARHAFVTDDCRRGRTDAGAVDEALDRLRAEATELLKSWDQGKGARFHFVLTVERPT